MVLLILLLLVCLTGLAGIVILMKFHESNPILGNIGLRIFLSMFVIAVILWFVSRLLTRG